MELWYCRCFPFPSLHLSIYRTFLWHDIQIGKFLRVDFFLWRRRIYQQTYNTLVFHGTWKKKILNSWSIFWRKVKNKSSWLGKAKNVYIVSGEESAIVNIRKNLPKIEIYRCLNQVMQNAKFNWQNWGFHQKLKSHYISTTFGNFYLNQTNASILIWAEDNCLLEPGIILEAIFY